ncbi:very short patch repair endonuclease [Jannaschia rubra]|uniref:very short patch repair endonuclease n=1 Tax=Jannaschia rubra TaxID=282197 RepID=UPI00094296A4|nr:very short patch repair endonuclease [Jannaschia rubra]
MVDTLTPEERSAHMRKIRGKDTKPEMVVRRMVHGLGYRYRLHKKGLPGSPDLAFSSRRKAIFVHGCFWHAHPDPGCPIAKTPKSRVDFWEAKFARNRERDQRKKAELEELGYDVLVVWECELRRNPPEAIKERLDGFLGGMA